jgi:hypothetical protein
VKSILFNIVSVVAVVAYFVPVAILLLKKLWPVKPFLYFALYWLAGGLVNVLLVCPVPRETAATITLVYNILDMPAVMAIFYITTSSPAIKKFAGIGLLAFTTVELVNLLIRGLHFDSLKYTMAIGLSLVLIMIVWEIIWYLQKITHTSREKGLLFIYAALLFEYGTYIIIYIFEYYLDHISSVTDNYLVYYISSVIALIIATCGYLTKGITRGMRKVDG